MQSIKVKCYLASKLSTITRKPCCTTYCGRTVKVKTKSLYHKPKRSWNEIRIYKVWIWKKMNLTSLTQTTLLDGLTCRRSYLAVYFFNFCSWSELEYVTACVCCYCVRMGDDGDDSCVMKYIEIVPLDNSGISSDSVDVKFDPSHVKVCVFFYVILHS